MKVTRTSVHRLTIEKTCGCQATREYEDIRYTKPTGDGVFTACVKHNKGAVAEFAGEMLIEALDKEAETAGKTAVGVPRGEVPTGLAGTTGGSVTSLGAPVIPKTREKQDPLKARTAHFDRPDMHKPSNTNLTGNLNVAEHDDISPEELEAEGITMDGSIDGVAEDPNVDAAMHRDMSKIDEILDEDDMRTSGVSQTLINRQAVD
jgi:hypothetical protein